MNYRIGDKVLCEMVVTDVNETISGETELFIGIEENEKEVGTWVYPYELNNLRKKETDIREEVINDFVNIMKDICNNNIFDLIDNAAIQLRAKYK